MATNHNYGYGNWASAASLTSITAEKRAKYEKLLDFMNNLEALNQAVPGRTGFLGAVNTTPARWSQIFALYQPPSGTRRPCKDGRSLQSKMSHVKKAMLEIIEENLAAEEEEMIVDTEDELETGEIRIGFESDKLFKKSS